MISGNCFETCEEPCFIFAFGADHGHRKRQVEIRCAFSKSPCQLRRAIFISVQQDQKAVTSAQLILNTLAFQETLKYTLFNQVMTSAGFGWPGEGCFCGETSQQKWQRGHLTVSFDY